MVIILSATDEGTGGGGGTVTGADNGLHLDGTVAYLGGTLLEDTTVDQAGFNLIFTNGDLLTGGEYKFINSLTYIGVPFIGFGWGDGTNTILAGISNGTNYTASYIDTNGEGGVVSIDAHGSAIQFASNANPNKRPKVEVNIDGVKIDGDNLSGNNTTWTADAGDGVSIQIANLNNNGNWQWNSYPNTRDDTGTFTPTSLFYPGANGEVYVAPISSIVFTIDNSGLWATNVGLNDLMDVRSAVSSGNGGFVAGVGAVNAADNAIVIGNGSSYSGVSDPAVTIGYNQTNTGASSVVIGLTSTNISGTNSVVIGNNLTNNPGIGLSGIVIGDNISNTARASIVICSEGFGSNSGEYGIVIGQATNSGGEGVSIGEASNNSGLAGMAIGGASVNTGINGLSILNGTNNNDQGMSIAAVSNTCINNSSGGKGGIIIGAGVGGSISNTGNYAITINQVGDVPNLTNSGDFSIVVGYGINNSGDGSIVIGNGASGGSGGDCIVMGSGSASTGNQTITLGVNAEGDGDDSVAIGTGSHGNSHYAVAIGSSARVTGNMGINIGANWATETPVVGDEAISIGTLLSQVAGDRSIAIGQGINDGGFDDCILMGQFAASVASNEFVIGTNITHLNAELNGATVGYVLTCIGANVQQWAPAFAGWSLTGNTGLTDGVDNLLGTTDDVPIRFTVNNIGAGFVSSGTSTFFGYSTGMVLDYTSFSDCTVFGNSSFLGATGTATNNTIVGSVSGNEITDGTQNTMLGSHVGASVDCSNSIGLGYNSLISSSNEFAIGTQDHLNFELNGATVGYVLTCDAANSQIWHDIQVATAASGGITDTVTTASLVGKTITISNGLITGFA